ncbi:phospholipid carrier-dependent glycosyltransferase [Candidatus Peregrinibacteria bacterium]|nr:phospholipid carrier-dependent glycosyltransferase [Candidatus Peregrinibacteria bacterium]MBT3598404.1 phospholipid carrier-dependent glycosyltransferase [Candidatus Peregrinibacteria bacterium]MBT4367441.1 phospholipid carrier-dependent glycosyltransferase [Candidatus Peregrinibacteria bacterium]MBT4585675.1 phospholipid carrier-dependent glycosyltransferase [Candidatus Peregrinibacteria bacterium]MBT6730441.1 phospholipid carrier-dependent glycosyltransferase [Candidatus Peregrinibacteria
MPAKTHKRRLKQTLFFGAFVLVLSYLTYVQNYGNPPHLFWDENYHVASAQKYMSGTFFMEPHPPLGKLLIAAGEELLQKNEINDQFIGTNYGRKLPADFSFEGYRLFPTLLGWLTAPLLFIVFLLITKNPLLSTLLTFPYIFDNAQIVHSRGAMLDSTMIFFAVALILLFILLLRCKDRPKTFSLLALLFGAFFGLIMATKALGLIMILLVPALFIRLLPNWNKIFRFSLYAFLGFIFCYVSAWQIHFSIATTLEPTLENDGYFQASEEYKSIIDAGQTSVPAAFFIQWRDSIKFLNHYSKGVPELNLCKPVENGSAWFMWPIGARTISYRWETSDSEKYRYLYIVPNPAGWWAGIVAVILAIGLLAASVFLPLRQGLKNPYLLLVFVGMYLSYMIAISRLDRVMYLYHYFLPLIFSYILIGLVFEEIKTVGKKKVTRYGQIIGLLLFSVLIFGAYEWFRPLTYYEPITNEQFERRNWVRLWDMHCVGCERNSVLVNTKKD